MGQNSTFFFNKSSFCAILTQQCFMPHIMTLIILLAVCTTLFSTNCCTNGRGEAQMGRGHFFIGCSVPQSPTHLVCSEKHLCTNLFVTIYWRDYLSSCHALVAAWCLKNMASHKFQAARLAGRLGPAHTSPSDCWGSKEGGNGVEERKGI